MGKYAIGKHKGLRSAFKLRCPQPVAGETLADSYAYLGVDIDLEAWYPSDPYLKFARNNSFQELYHVRRTTPYKPFVSGDPYVQTFFQDKGIYTDSYKMCFPNHYSAYRSNAKYDLPYNELTKNANLECMRLAAQAMEKHFVLHLHGCSVTPLENAVYSLDKTTSPGYPWNLSCNTKKEFFEKFESVCKEQWLYLRPVPLWFVSVKKEIRSEDRIDFFDEAANMKVQKLRTFTASPVQFSVLLIMLCLDFNNRFYAAANKTWSTVGMTKFYRQWNELYQRLAPTPEFARNAFELDAEEFDSRLLAFWFQFVMQFRFDCFANAYKTKYHAERMEYAYAHVVYSYMVLTMGELIRKMGGNPSGSANTIVDNTLILFMAFAYAWFRLAPNHLANYSSFMLHVRAALNGDDNTYCCSDEAAQFFYPSNIAKVLAEVGMKITYPTNSPRKLEECHYLSHGFVWSPGMRIWLPLPERAKVIASLCNNTTTQDPKWSLLRAYALRMESWADVELRQLIMELIIHLKTKYASQLLGSINNMSMTEIDSVFKTDAELVVLYSGLEASPLLKEASGKAAECFMSNDKNMSTVGQTVNNLTEQYVQLIGEMSRSFGEFLGKLARVIDSGVPLSADESVHPNTTVEVPAVVPPQPRLVGIELNPGPDPDKKNKRKRNKNKNKQNAKQQPKPAPIASVPRPRAISAPGKKKMATQGVIGSFLGGLAGNALAGPGGAAVGKVVGDKLGDWAWDRFKGIFGHGSYRISNNTISKPLAMGQQPPTFSKTADTRIRHREYIQDITSSTGFSISGFSINPGIQATFPWLSSVASCFEEYELHGIIFEFVSTSSDYSATPAMGSVIMAAQYNALRPAFANKQDMDNYEYACSDRPSHSFIHAIECARADNPLNELYIRTAPVSSGDIRLYDLATFYIATNGNVTDGSNLGELWVSYDITLKKPRLTAQAGGLCKCAHYSFTSFDNTNVLGGTVTKITDSIGITYKTVPRQIVSPTSIQQGYYDMMITWRGTGAAYTPPIVTMTNAVAFYNDYLNKSIAISYAPVTSVVSDTVSLMLSFQVTGPGATITFGTGVLPTAGTYSDLFIYQKMPANLMMIEPLSLDPTISSLQEQVYALTKAMKAQRVVRIVDEKVDSLVEAQDDDFEDETIPSKMSRGSSYAHITDNPLNTDFENLTREQLMLMLNTNRVREIEKDGANKLQHAYNGNPKAFAARPFYRWLKTAETSKTTYHKARSVLWDQLVSIRNRNVSKGTVEMKDYIIVQDADMVQLRSFLQSRSEEINQNGVLAFNEMIVRMLTDNADYDDGGDDEEEQAPVVHD